MKVLFVTTEHPELQYGGLGSFTRDFVLAMKEYAEIRVLYLHYSESPPPLVQSKVSSVDYILKPNWRFPAQSIEASIIENSASLFAQSVPILQEFQSDIIHTNDRLSYLPFRFQNNTIFSSHLLFTDMLGTQALNDVYFQELKIERMALENAALVIVYSAFAQKRAWEGLTVNTQPIVLPLGFFPNHFSPKKIPGRVRIAFFGRIDSLQKGFFEAIKAIRLLGQDFRTKHCLEFSVYGRGEIPTDFYDVVDTHEFLSGEELTKAFARTDIVLMPSRYEPFGLVGLEALASGCILLYTPGLGMDEYTIPEINALPVMPNALEISNELKKVIENLDHYQKTLGETASISVQNWNWERSAKSHFYLFHEWLQNGTKRIDLAYSKEYSLIFDKLNKNHNYQQTILEDLCLRTLDSNGNSCLIHGFSIDINFLTSQWDSVISIWERNLSTGLVPKLEWLPYPDSFFTEVIIILAWEMVVFPKEALIELIRITSSKVTIYYWTGELLPWQVTQMEKQEDWHHLMSQYTILHTSITKSKWKIVQYQKEGKE